MITVGFTIAGIAHTSCSIGLLPLTLSYFAYCNFGFETASEVIAASVTGPVRSMASTASSLANAVASLSAIVLWTYLSDSFMAQYSQNKHDGIRYF